MIKVEKAFVHIDGDHSVVLAEASTMLYALMDALYKDTKDGEYIRHCFEFVVGNALDEFENKTGIQIVSDDEEDEEDDGVEIPPDIFKNFMNGGDLLF